jgi:hypothetical protein
MSHNIFTKIEYPPCGFILQKDVYTTNLLYANNQFPLTSLKKRLPFRPPKRLNPNNSVTILRQNGKISDNSENKKEFYFFNTFKPKYLLKRKLKFPVPQGKQIPLTNLNLYEEISKKDVKIKNIDDDLNITSNNGRKIFYRFKEHKLFSTKKSIFPSISANNFFGHGKRAKEETSMGKISLKNIISQLNDDLRNLKQMELDRKKSFIKDKFFSTQIYINRLIEKSD